MVTPLRKATILSGTEILVFLSVPEPADELVYFRFPSGCQRDIFLVFSHPLRPVTGKHPEKRHDIKKQADPVQDPQAGKTAGKRYDEP